MKNFNLFIVLVLSILFVGCQQDDSSTAFIANAEEAIVTDVMFGISDDNSGDVTITPLGNNVLSFDVFFGDDTINPVTVINGESVEHTYASEGIYEITVLAYNAIGEISEYKEDLEVSFKAPENLTFQVIPDNNDFLTYSIQADADFATYIEVYFGEFANEFIQIAPGDTATYTYQTEGEYSITIIAYSGGAAVTQDMGTIDVSIPQELEITFDDPDAMYTFNTFGGNQTVTVVDNPDVFGNLSPKAVQWVDGSPSEVWAGAAMSLTNSINFGEGTTISMKVWSPSAGTLFKLKIESLADANSAVEIDVLTTTTNAWEVLTYDFSTTDYVTQFATNPANNLVIFPNFGVDGGNVTYYIDNIVQGEQSLDTVLPILPIDFESSAGTFNLFGFGGSATEDVVGQVVNNPDASGINTSSKVGTLNKPVDAEVFAGVAIPLRDGYAIDFSGSTLISVDVWSPRSGIPVLLKIENSAGDAAEIEVMTTQSNSWETLTYDLNNAPGFNSSIDYTQVDLFFDFGTAGMGEVFYFDNIRQ
ncbi:PKD domain-containing protein [uncultured Aquimarina sp.]|uniref:PKD domain-containing protein n=1 Tax=uncultured Aquimarina sp. TaxID=575652 RepID=UPI0026266130|nr:PKD domain-containing protein [uncultured Aquimarina sp.]